MTTRMQTFSSREDWLRARQKYIGGSDAAAAIGKSSFKDNVTLWMEKTGQIEPQDISDKPYVQYGTQAEKHLRELFGLDFPEYEVMYEPDNMWLNDSYPWAHYSADGWLLDQDGRKGILEIKSTTIMGSDQYKTWKAGIPEYYHWQLIHGFMVTEFDFAILKAQIKFGGNDDYYITRHYLMDRQPVESDIQYLAGKEKAFWGCVQSGQRPARILPEI